MYHELNRTYASSNGFGTEILNNSYIKTHVKFYTSSKHSVDLAVVLVRVWA
jgi:hypothetical protein